MIQRRQRAAAIGVWVWASVGSAAAASLSGAAVLATDKVYRGLSQSDGHASLLVDVTGRSDTGWSASVGLATLAPGGEWQVSLNRSWQAGDDWAVVIGAEHHGYVSTRRPYHRYDECFASLDWQGRVVASLAAAPDLHVGASSDGQRRSGWAFTYELAWREPWGASLAIDAGIGYYDLHRVASVAAGYGYGSVGLGWRLTTALQLHLSRVASNAAARGFVPTAIAGQRWMASLIWVF